MTTRVDAERVTAYRVAAHHLHERLPADAAVDAAGACGLQDSPPGSGLLALHARVDDVGPGTLADAVEDRSVIHAWSMRGSPYYFPTSDHAVFTTGVLPVGDKAGRRFVLGVDQALDRLGMTLDDVVGRTRSAVRVVLDGRRLAIDELGRELARRIAGDLPDGTRREWEEEGPYARGQPLGEGVVHFCLRILSLERVVCFAHRSGTTLPFVLTEQWLGAAPPDVDADAARAEITRRHLHCYGPSTRAELAAWLGLASGDARSWWASVEDEIAAVVVDGRTRWLLAEDLDALLDPPPASGVRMLPPRDPLLQLRDRATLVPDTTLHRRIWRSVGDPGVVLADGRPVGTWRPRKKGRTLALTVEPFTTLTTAVRDGLEAEAGAVAVLRGADAAEVRVEP